VPGLPHTSQVLRRMLRTMPASAPVFKDFPLEQLHRGTDAAIAGRCAYQQDPKAFWKMYDSSTDNQEIISAANALDATQEWDGC